MRRETARSCELYRRKQSTAASRSINVFAAIEQARELAELAESAELAELAELEGSARTAL